MSLALLEDPEYPEFALLAAQAWPPRDCESSNGFINFKSHKGLLYADCKPFSIKVSLSAAAWPCRCLLKSFKADESGLMQLCYAQGINWFGSEDWTRVVQGLDRNSMDFYFRCALQLIAARGV